MDRWFRFEYECVACGMSGAEIVDCDDVNHRTVVGDISITKSKDHVAVLMGKTPHRQISCRACGGTKFHESEFEEAA